MRARAASDAADKTAGQPSEFAIELTLVTDGNETILAWEDGTCSRTRLAAYGAGIQVYVDDLSAHLAGRERCEAEARWHELLPACGGRL